ncbi:retrovirus-related pol polyprotein from transposon TNT 1-94, partial [Tanacetum coccineum]
NKYVLLNYAPGTANDRVVNGPVYIPNGFHSFVGAPFALYGIDASYGCHGDRDESFIFSGRVDVAFESSVPNEVYIFKGGEYALADYIQ